MLDQKELLKSLLTRPAPESWWVYKFNELIVALIILTA